jgi:NAD(P)-dependent dehydrogenase (short-subunit alcohol dehydrogenase family)
VSTPDLEGRTAVITGASRGIGAELARACAELGMNLGLCARSAPVLDDGDSVLCARLDVTDEAAMVDFAKGVEARFGSVDLWVNNAGVLEPIAPLRDVSVEDFRRHIDVNLTGVFVGSREYVRLLRRRGDRGVLINISSGAAWNGYEGWGAYCAAKAGADRLTEVIAMEEASNGLRAYSVAPGVVDTDMQAMIRDCTPERFPMVDRFVEMKRDDVFNSGAYVARELLAIAFDPDRSGDAVAVRLEDEKG